MNIKDLFRTGEESAISTVSNENSDNRVNATTITFNQWGRQQAEDLGGHAATLLPALHAAHRRVIQQVKADEIEQTRRKEEIQSKIDILKSEKENLAQKREQKYSELQHEERKIEDSKAEVTAIRNDPSRVTKQKGSQIGRAHV